MNPEELKEVQLLQELLTKFNSEASYITVMSVVIDEVGDAGSRIGKMQVGDDGETMFFFQAR